MLSNAFWFWSAAWIALLAAEVILPGIYLFWIAWGALAVGVFVGIWPDASTASQFILYAVATLASVTLGTYLNGRSKRTEASSGLNSGLSVYLGSQALAIQAFASGRGRISIHDTTYDAYSTDSIAQNDLVVVQAVQDNGFLVSKVVPGLSKEN